MSKRSGSGAAVLPGKGPFVAEQGEQGRRGKRATAGPIDTSVAHQARVYDYWLGGKDNFRADREAAELALQAYPGLRRGVQAQRAFLGRAVHYLVTSQGVRQFLDIGTGLPAANNTHEVAQAAAAECRVVYVDNDPLVLSHARALLASDPRGVTDYLDADLRNTGDLLARAAATLDFDQPMAIMLIGILQLIGDADQPYQIVQRLLDTVPAGSFLAIAHPASDIMPDRMGKVADELNQRSATPTTLRTREQIAAFFSGTTLIPPGLVQMHRWYPDGQPDQIPPDVIPLHGQRAGGSPPASDEEEIPAYCGLGRKS